jgi:hypothetical protein
MDPDTTPVPYRIGLIISCILGVLYMASRVPFTTPNRLRLGILGAAVVVTSTIWTALAKTEIHTQQWPYAIYAAWFGCFIAFSGEPNAGTTRAGLHVFTYLIFSAGWNVVLSLNGPDLPDAGSTPGANSDYIPLCWSAWQVALRFVFYFASDDKQGRRNADETMHGTEMGFLGQGQNGEDGEALDGGEEGGSGGGHGDEHHSNNADDNEVAPVASQSEGLRWNIHELPVGGLHISANDWNTEQPINDEHDPHTIAANNGQSITDGLQASTDALLTSDELAVVTTATVQTASDTQLATKQAADGGAGTVAMATHGENS